MKTATCALLGALLLAACGGDAESCARECQSSPDHVCGALLSTCEGGDVCMCHPCDVSPLFMQCRLWWWGGCDTYGVADPLCGKEEADR